MIGYIEKPILLSQEVVTLRAFNCQQKLVFSDTPTSGSFKIKINEATTDAIAYDNIDVNVQNALLDESITATVTGDYTSLLITFTNKYGNADIDNIEITENTLQDVSIEDVLIEVSYTGRGLSAIGVYQEGVAVDTEISVSFQPYSSDNYKQEIGSDRLESKYELFTKSSIDRDCLIIKNSLTYDINKIERWHGYNSAIVTERRPS